MRQPSFPTRPEIDAFLAPILALVAWLFSLIGAPRNEMRRAIAQAERAVQYYIFLRAVVRTEPPARPRRRRPALAPPGFRRGRASRRLFFRSARIAHRRADFLTRIARLVAVLAKPERYIARFVARFARGLRPRALIVIAPPASTFASAGAPAPRPADSS